MAVVITVEQLTRRFGDTVAVDNLSLEVKTGEVFGFLGHNGAGKTTTVRLLNGLLLPTEGTIRVMGFDPTVQGSDLRRQTGVLTETPSLTERLTARENLRIFSDLYGVSRSQISDRIAELLTMFGLVDQADQAVGTFSKGMKQRLALARALLHRPRLIFLDEPASGLDPVATRQLHELIIHLSREEGRTIFLCTHNLAEAQTLCDRVAVMQQGRLLALGEPSALAGQVEQGHHLRIEVETGAVEAALPALRGVNGLGDVTLNGRYILIAGIARATIPKIVAALVSVHTPIYQISYEEPTLEDVYFSLHEDFVSQEAEVDS